MRLRPLFWLTLLALLAATLPAAGDEAAQRKQDLRDAEAPLRDRDWTTAAARLHAFREQNTGTDEAIEAWVLESRALLEAGSFADALDATSAFLAAHGESAWAGRMKHNAADAYAGLKEHGKEAVQLRERVEAMTTKEARAAIGTLHVELADRDFDGVEETDDLGRTKKVRHVDRALESYEHALTVGVLDSERARVRARIAKAYEELGKPAEAAARWQALLDDAKEGKLQADAAARTGWRVGLGRSLLAAKKRDEARAALRAALEEKPEAGLQMEILLLLGEERLQAAAAGAGDTAFDEGVTWIRRAIVEHKEDPRAPEAQKRLAEAYEKAGQPLKAAAEWSSLIERFPNEKAVPDARDRMAKALLAAGHFDDAIRAWEQFLTAHPNHPDWPKVRGAIVDAAFQKGTALLADDDKPGAITAWRAFAGRYPTDSRAPQALLQAGLVLRSQDDFEGALASWRQVEGRYATSSQAPQALFLIGETLDTRLGRLEEAVATYEDLIKKHGDSPYANQARARLDRLKEKELELRMDRVVGSGEEKTIRVRTRNIESLDVRVYRLDLEEYFRRKGTTAGVENLQLEVVKPDKTATWKVDPYQPYAMLEASRIVPVQEKGAYVIVAGDEDLTATVLFLVSDLEIVTKMTAGRDLFVWAFDRDGQQPVAGARVVTASPGKHPGARDVGATGEDGVLHERNDRHHDGESVLVVSDAGFAVSGFGKGPAVVEGFRSKAYVYTDRPIYRPGQEVSWRGLFLRARGGGYEAPHATKATMRVRDARGQALFEREVSSSAFGAFAGTFTVDGGAPLGIWKVELTVPREGTWMGEFEVQEFHKPELTVEVAPERAVYLTGETVETLASVRYAFGGPVANAPLQFAVYRTPATFAPSDPDDYAWYVKSERDRTETRRSVGGGTLVARGEVRTGSDGDARIRFDAADLDEDSMYRIRVAVQDVTRRWVYDEGRIPVTRRDHMAAVRTDRKVYRPKQDLRAEIRTMDALENPVARSGEVVLLEVQSSAVPSLVLRGGPGGRGGRAVPVREEEVPVASYPLSTGKDGRAELKLQLPSPGRWRIRWRATDGRGGLVTASTDVEASGETEDASKHARLVAARSVVTEGEAAEVLLRSPVVGVKALLTYEAAGVLEYRFLDVRGTSTMLGLPVTARDAPNVFFKVAIPGDGELLEAETEVVVLRYLGVEVEAPRTAKPGEMVAVTVKTTDAAGRPTPAEVSVALIDETLYALAPDRAPQIRPYFYDHRRTNAVQTASSLGFEAAGTTRPTNKDLLADEAVRSGDAGRAIARAALQGARDALDRGDVASAAVLAVRATEADPASFEARRLLEELGDMQGRQGEVARKALADLGATHANDARIALREKMEDLKKMNEPADAAPAMSDRLEADNEGGWEESVGEGGVSDAPFEGASTNGAIGLGGGAGGSFRGRGGGRVARAQGGGGKAWAATKLPSRVASELYGNPSGWVDKAAKAFGFDVGIEVETRERFEDTAFWKPHLVTGEDGRGEVEVELPDNLTTWRAVVRGVSASALVGEGRGRITARKDLHVRIDAPRFLVQSDEVTVPVAVHNDTGEKQDVVVGVEADGVTLGGQDETLTLDAGGIGVSDRDAASEMSGRVRFQATAVAGGLSDRTSVAFPALPRGLHVVEGATGVVDVHRGEVQESMLQVPDGAIPGATQLALVVYPGVDSQILDALLSLDLFPYGCIEQTVHRFLPAIEARAALLAAGSPEAARLDQLQEAIRRGAIRLRNLQNQDGSFGWFGAGQGDVAMTAYALTGLDGARRAGVEDLDAAIDKAIFALAKLLRSGGADEDRRALGHLALARVGRIDAESWATTFRRRNDDLSTSGLAWMAMAATRLHRSFDEDELVRLILARRLEEGTTTHWKGARGDCFVGSDREATGLAVRALIEAKAPGPHAERGLQWLLANPVKGGFGTTKETAAFVGAASAWVELHGAQGYGGTIQLLLDGAPVRTITVGPKGLAASDRRFLVPEAAAWTAGRHRVGFRLDGQGSLRWAARLDAVVASDDLPADQQGLAVERTYLRQEEAPVEGQPAPFKPGYDVLRPAARPRLEARELDVVNAGDRVLVRIALEADRDLDYVMVEDPLPAGFQVLDETTEGPITWSEHRDDRQVFFLAQVPKGPVVIRYVLQAVHWGRFTALGTTASPMYLPQVHGRAAGKVLRVARQDIHGTDAEHPPTPDEVFARAERLFAEGDREHAVPLYRELRDTQPLRDDIIETIEARLLVDAVDRGDAREIVRAREALLRRDPARIPDDWGTARSIAFAYQDIGEVEVASGLYRDLVARAFGLRVDWMQTLAARGEEVEGLDDLGRSLRSFPVANATAEAALRRALRYSELPRPKDHDGEAGEPMDREGLDALWSWTAHFAGTPFADPGNYALIGALRGSGDIQGAERAAEAFLRRFPGSVHEDDAWFFLAESRYRAFEQKPTEDGAKRVAEAAHPLVDRKFPDRSGQKSVSEFRPRALHILARVHHVMGDLAEAVRLYYAARSIEDAREAYEFLTKERLRLPSTHVLSIAGGASVPVSYQNVGTLELKAYPVDLQVLFAVRRSLEGLHDVDLSGIVPKYSWTQTFENGKDHLPHEGSVTLPVEADGPGAWLVVAKAGASEAKALVLKTDLHAEIQGVDEKARVYVTDDEGAPVGSAYVVISDGSRIRARGLTDGRGVLEAPGVGRGVSVVVSKDDRAAIAHSERR